MQYAGGLYGKSMFIHPGGAPHSTGDSVQRATKG